MFAKSILALLGSIRAREEGRLGAPRPQPVVMPASNALPAQQTQYNRYDQERFIRQKEGKQNNNGKEKTFYILLRLYSSSSCRGYGCRNSTNSAYFA